ncbi:Pollen Ole e 1 allergen and extensin family protein [Rhynchospora pubera]|uniref:Pollen Ole e 1 allergen and extensin family protein n=1 Tax=Rhynchospora pubera TaxID=906938 RepID=A0AAV8FIU7_9POAL|nr:Pollen Ole e 1 allergen and extensin family protein [Rhynchospora pubera]
MAVKVYVLLAMLVFAGVVTPIAHAELLGGILGTVLSVKGIVPCSIGGNSSTTSVFPNAGVQLRCASSVLGSTTTDNNGAFSIVGLLPLVFNLLGCNVVVTTPLVSCNASLPSTGSLTAVLKPVVSNLGILLDIVPGVFSLVPNIN